MSSYNMIFTEYQNIGLPVQLVTGFVIQGHI